MPKVLLVGVYKCSYHLIFLEQVLLQSILLNRYLLRMNLGQCEALQVMIRFMSVNS